MEQNTSTSQSLKDELLAYNNLEEISANIFHKIKFSGQITLMHKNYQEDREYSSLENDFLYGKWLSLYDDYFEQKDDVNMRNELKNKDKTREILTNISLINEVLKPLESLERNKKYTDNEVLLKIPLEIFKQLSRRVSKIKYNSSLSLRKNIDNLKSIKGGLETKYELLFKDDMNITEQTMLDYYAVREMMEDIFKRNLPDYVNMLQWITYEKSVIRKIRSARKYNSRKETG